MIVGSSYQQSHWNIQKYPPRQSAASFNLDEVLKKMQESKGD